MSEGSMRMSNAAEMTIGSIPPVPFQQEGQPQDSGVNGSLSGAACSREKSRFGAKKGVQLDEPSSPQSKHFNEDLCDIVGELTNPKSSVHESKSSKSSNRHTPLGNRCERTHRTKSKEKMGTFSKGHNDDDNHGLGSPKRQSKSNCDNSADAAQNSQDINVEFMVTLNLEEDEGLEIKDMNVEIPPGDVHAGIRAEPEDEECSTDDSTEISDIKEVDQVDGLDNVGSKKHQSAKKTEKHSEKKEKESKKRRFRKLMSRPLRRSQSAGCEADLQVPEHALFLGEEVYPDRKDEICSTKRTIHKTTSADAAMMASEVLPVDPQDLGLPKSKPKTSLAKNMKRKLQALRRRNTDSSLGVTIMKLQGTSKISPTDISEWSKSFESLLSDKNGLEMFRNFLKSEFSEENIDFWIACEEFKTTRTNKLAQKAEQIYTDYVAVKAPRQVNLDSKTRLETVTNLDNPTRDMYKSAQKRIQYLMEKDPYPRFLESEVYLQIARQCSRCDSG